MAKSQQLIEVLDEGVENLSPVATLVSLCPFKIKETKPGLSPGTFEIPAVKIRGDFNILHVGISRYGVYLDGDRGSLTVPELGERIGKSIVMDFVNSQFGIDAESEAMPGLFVLNGKLSKKTVEEEHGIEIVRYGEMQDNWFKRLVMHADDSWARFPGRHSAITDLQRIAAKWIGFSAPWVF